MEDLAASAAVSLMTADIAGLDQLLTRLHATWASCIELGLGIFVLYKFVGAACFLIFIPTISMTTRPPSLCRAVLTFCPS